MGAVIGQSLINANNGENYYFTNHCSSPVRLAIRYKNIDGEWVSDGWWHFDPGESAYLSANGDRLTSNNTIWYYYAEPTDNFRGYWGGNNQINFDGQKLKMREVRDSNGRYDWAIKCD